MTTPVFTWQPTTEATGEASFRVRSAQFGDGYRQAAADGINNRTQSWQLSFAGDSLLIGQIKAFLDARKGAERFYWTPPLETQKLFTAAAYSIRPCGGGAYTLAVTFTESFQP